MSPRLQADTTTSIQSSESVKSELAAAIALKDEQIQILQRDTQQLTADRDSIVEQLAREKDLCQSLSSQLNDASTRRDELQYQLGNAESLFESERTSFASQFIALNSQFSSERDQLYAQLEEDKDACRSLMAQLEDSRNRCTALENELATAASENSRVLSEVREQWEDDQRALAAERSKVAMAYESLKEKDAQLAQVCHSTFSHDDNH